LKSLDVKERAKESPLESLKDLPLTVALLTSGGDSPGMNACVRAVVRMSLYKGYTIYGVLDGYQGLIDGILTELGITSVSGIINRGGTILRTARSEEFKTRDGMKRAQKTCEDFGIDALITIGGDGTFRGASEFTKLTNIPVICIPASIDNDVYGTDNSIGFDTAVNTIVSITDRLRDTAESHKRVFLVEVMGRETGAIASAVGLACGAEVVIIPEMTFNIEDVSTTIEEGYIRGKNSFIVIIAEGALSKKGMTVYDAMNEMKRYLKREIRVLVPGHIQRGGPPTSYDRILASRLGAYAVELLSEGVSGVMTGIQSDNLVHHSLSESIGKSKSYNYSYHQLANILGK